MITGPCPENPEINIFPLIGDVALGRGLVKSLSLLLTHVPSPEQLATFVAGLEMDAGSNSNNLLWGFKLASQVPINLRVMNVTFSSCTSISSPANSFSLPFFLPHGRYWKVSRAQWSLRNTLAFISTHPRYKTSHFSSCFPLKWKHLLFGLISFAKVYLNII